MLAGDESLGEQRRPTLNAQNLWTEYSGHAESTKSKLSGTGNFRTGWFQRKGINVTAPQPIDGFADGV